MDSHEKQERVLKILSDPTESRGRKAYVITVILYTGWMEDITALSLAACGVWLGIGALFPELRLATLVGAATAFLIALPGLFYPVRELVFRVWSRLV